MAYSRHHPLNATSLKAGSVSGAATAAVSGASSGSTQATNVSSKAIQELSVSKRDSLLAAIKELKAIDDDKLGEPVNVFPGAKDAASTHQGVGSAAANIGTAASLAALNLTQLPLDVSTVITEIIKLSKFFPKSFDTKQSSLLEPEVDNGVKFSLNCSAFTKQLNEARDELGKNLKEDFKAESSFSHVSAAQTTATTLLALPITGTSALAAIFDSIGHSFREIYAIFAQSKQEWNADHRNVYEAFQECAQSLTSPCNLEKSFAALKNLENVLTNTVPARDLFTNHNVTAPASIVSLRSITSLPFVESLRAFNSSSVACFLALEEATAQHEKVKELFKQSIPQASSIKQETPKDEKQDNKKNSNTHSQNMTELCALLDQIDKKLDEANINEKAADDAIIKSAQSTVRTNPVTISSLITAAFGVVSREISGITHFILHPESHQQAFKNVSASDPNESGLDMDRLLSNVLEMQKHSAQCTELGVAAPSLLGSTQSVLSGATIGSLNTLVGALSALIELRTFLHSPSDPSKLDEKEQRSAEANQQSMKDINQRTAKSTGTEGVSNDLTLHTAIKSLMEHSVLIRRSFNNFSMGVEKRDDINCTARSTIGSVEKNSTGFLLGFLAVLSLTGLETGMSVETLSRALYASTQAKRVSAGIDKIELSQQSHTNLSFLSNATRLARQGAKGSKTTQSSLATTHLVAETTFSRPLTVISSQFQLIKQVLKERITEEEAHLADNDPKNVQEPAVEAPAMALHSARLSDALMTGLHKKLDEKFENAEGERRIPHLNEDMAYGIETTQNASLSSSLIVHDAITAPLLKSRMLLQKACVIPNDLKNEALTAQSELARITSQGLNILQAFSKQCLDKIDALELQGNNNTVGVSTDTGNNASLSVLCGTSLLLEELFETLFSRSLTLLDDKKLDELTKDLKKATKEKKDAAIDQIKMDSDADAGYPSTRVISALRLTISHLGNALGELAGELRPDNVPLQNDLKIHLSQQQLIKSQHAFISHCASSLSILAASLSTSPFSTAGSTEALHSMAHLCDNHLRLHEVHSSENNTSRISSLTAIPTDCVASMLSSAIKLILQSIVLGSDSVSAVSRLMAILSLHPKPEQKLSLETEAASMPNGLSKNLSDPVNRSSVFSGLTFLGATQASQTQLIDISDNTWNSLRPVIDQKIDDVAFLEDAEQNDTTIGLTEFYKQLIIILLNENTTEYNPDNLNDLLERLNHGGIALTNYHSRYGKKENKLINGNTILGGDDLEYVLNLFIRKATKNKSLLTDLKSKLETHPLSEKATRSWAYIVNNAIDNSMFNTTTFFLTRQNKKAIQELNALKHSLLGNVRVENSAGI